MIEEVYASDPIVVSGMRVRILLGRSMSSWLSPSKNYCTHIEVNGKLYWGHYDMTREEAIEDFRRRCLNEGLVSESTKEISVA